MSADHCKSCPFLACPDCQFQPKETRAACDGCRYQPKETP